MLPPCFRLADDVFPKVRAVAAHQMHRKGVSQTTIAQHLGVSQAMVSKYLAKSAPDDALARRLARDLDATAPGAQASWCSTLAADTDALRDMAAAIEILATAPGIIPQVGLNLAVAPPGATAPDQILALPARMVRAGDQAVCPLPPAPGASGHLARILLAQRRHNPALAAILNVRATSDIQKRAGRLGTVTEVDRGGDTTEAPLLAARGVILHDPGAVGLEPTLYLLGTDPIRLARNALTLVP